MQESFLVASAAYVKAHPATVRDFLKAYLRGALEVTGSGGKWTPELLDEVAKWSGLPKQEIAKLAGPTYVGQLGTISPESIAREEDYFAGLGLVTTKIDVASLIDDGPLKAARKELNIAQ
jgi:ABC-type nitrate/sulfonate/bicarbonate transport system substrate-binding protein